VWDLAGRLGNQLGGIVAEPGVIAAEYNQSGLEPQLLV
jgi:hypothetical protein